METVNQENPFVAQPTAGDSYRKGWKLAFTVFVELIAVTLVYAIVQIPNGLFQIPGDDDFKLVMIPLGMFALAYGIFISGPIGMSADWVFLKAVRREKIEIRDMFSVFERNYWNAVIAGIVKAIIIGLGFLMLIVPGIIFACRLAFVNYLIIDEKMEAMQALKTSWAMTKGHGWTIFGMALLAFPIIIGGLIALFFGVFIAVLWITASFAVLYHAVYVKEGIPVTNGSATPPAAT